MPLSQKHRSTIYQKLEPILGEEEAEALLSQFPARELDEPITKEFVRAELAEFRTEFRGEIAELRTEIADFRAEVRGEMADVRAETRSEIADLRVEMHQLANRTLFSFSAVTIAAMGLAVTLSRFA